MILAETNQEERKIQLGVFNAQMSQAVLDASDQQSSFDIQMAQIVLDASDKQANFDSQLAQAALDASDRQMSFSAKLAKVALDASDKQSDFDNQLAQAVLASADKQVSFSAQLAKVALDASDRQADFDNQMSQAMVSCSIQPTRLVTQICDEKGAFDELTNENVQQLSDGSCIRVDVSPAGLYIPAVYPRPWTSLSSSDAHVDGKGTLRRKSSYLRRSSVSSPTSDSNSRRFSFTTATDHSKLSNHHGCVTIFFSDLIGFSSWAHKLPPDVVMATLNDLYTRLDDIILEEMPGVYKASFTSDAIIWPWAECMSMRS